MTGTRYTMSDANVERARAIGLARQREGEARGRSHRYAFEGSREDSLRLNTEGAASEMVVAHHLGLDYAPGPECDYAGDIGEGVQVRSTVREDGCLILHPADADLDYFVLVVGTLPRLRVVGWTLGGEGKREDYWREDVRHPAFFVPQRALMALPRNDADRPGRRPTATSV